MSGGSCSAVLLGEDTKSAGGLVSAAGGEGLLEEKVCWGRRSAGGEGLLEELPSVGGAVLLGDSKSAGGKGLVQCCWGSQQVSGC